jgi:hypothetical protein
MLVMHSPSTLVRQRLDVILTRLHTLIKTACDPYRPELHYVRAQSGARSDTEH